MGGWVTPLLLCSRRLLQAPHHKMCSAGRCPTLSLPLSSIIIFLQEALLPFLGDAGASMEGAGGSEGLAAATLSYWASLPWSKVGGVGREA